jgi:alpha-D-ribose 1-methylphosphonate 5-triphosphate synthase subunit PhnL
MKAALEVCGLNKTFVMHLREGARLPVLENVSFTVMPGECVALRGPSGAGKSTLMRMIFGNYRCHSGAILVRHQGGTIDLAQANLQQILAVRRATIGYVSQFLRVIPRVPALTVVAEAARSQGMVANEAFERARALLQRLNLPERMWSLPPATFSGGEQQRVNIARGLIGSHTLLLLDEPTASLDAENRAVVVDMINERRASGTAMVGIFHDDGVRAQVAMRAIDIVPVVAARP